METRLVESLFGQAVVVVDRKIEAEQATRRLDQMLSGLTVSDCVLFFHGVSGVGKTTLLHRIRDECDGRGVPSAWVDFDRKRTVDGRPAGDRYDGSDGRVKIVQQLMEELDLATPSVGPVLSPEEAAPKLLSSVHNLPPSRLDRPLVLFFDTIEDSDLETFLWVQQEILAPLLNQFRYVLVVMAGRTAPNTLQRNLIYPLERRASKHQLQPFDSRWTDVQLDAMDFQDVELRGEALTRYTGGLPVLNYAAARWMAERIEVEQLLERLVDEIVFKRLADQADRDVKAETLAVAVLRQFDSVLLGKLMRVLWPDKYAAPGIRPIRALLGDLQQTSLVEPHPDGYGYTVPHDLRAVLDLYGQQTQPNMHFLVHQTAAQWFAKQVEEGDYVAIADRLYHLGGLWRDVEEHSEFVDRLEPDLRPEPSAYDKLAGELRATLEALRDDPRAFDLANKIKSVLGRREFKWIFDERIVERLIGLCEVFNHQLS